MLGFDRGGRDGAREAIAAVRMAGVRAVIIGSFSRVELLAAGAGVAFGSLREFAAWYARFRGQA